ncbi:MAG: hypothetical protein KTU85_06845 [Acidimicrobiia bacterium]|nr:hypothetical protein [Acidimicrobiia bacterium]MCY4457746.1 hypothetical protein [Acidimicrobiaceae bacterium]
MLNEELDAREYVNRIQTEIEAEARELRHRDPDLELLEKEIEKTWKGIAPNSAGSTQQHLLDRVEQLSLVDVHAPTGQHFGESHLKRVIRKLTRWYMRFVVDQLNALHHFQGRLLRLMDQRLSCLERDSQMFEIVNEFVDPVPEADAELCRVVSHSLRFVDKPVAVVSCGGGAIVAALMEAGVVAHGVDEMGPSIMTGINLGLDLRVGSALKHFEDFADSTLGAVVLTRFVERQGIVDSLSLIDEALRCVVPAGAILVAVAEPAARQGIEADLLAGKGLSSQTWAHLLKQRGCTVETVEVSGSRVAALVLARTA